MTQLTNNQIEIRAVMEKHNSKVREKIQEDKDTEQFHIILEHAGIRRIG